MFTLCTHFGFEKKLFELSAPIDSCDKKNKEYFWKIQFFFNICGNLYLF